jgi:hypothetical protein
MFYRPLAFNRALIFFLSDKELLSRSLVLLLINLDLTPMDTMGIKPWISKTHGRWLEIGAPKFLANIGIDFESNFLQSIKTCGLSENPYLNCKWEIIPHSVIPVGVLHCYPIEINSARVTWEEWFLMDGEIHHHILSNLAFESEQGVWTPDADDKDHPIEVLGRSWHYQNTSDLRPSLLITKGK